MSLSRQRPSARAGPPRPAVFGSFQSDPGARTALTTYPSLRGYSPSPQMPITIAQNLRTARTAVLP